MTSRMRYSATSISAALLILLAGCATAPQPAGFCESAGFLIDDRFEGGNFYECTVTSARSATLEIRPEDAPPINRSPWYAFRLSPKSDEPITVRLDFTDGYARYWPKLSADGRNWRRAPESTVTMLDDGNAMQLRLDVDGPRLFVAAQELLTSGFYDPWIDDIRDSPAVEVSLLSRSIDGRPIYVAQSAPRREVVYLIGRQHPPEISGALAMRPFIDTVLADTELARAFRERYMLVIIPLINPDGVAAGHWRHNLDGTDLNRDWGPFLQPETQGAKRLVDQLDAEGRRPALMLDFHSTRASLFYTQLPEESSWTIDFATEWFARFRERRSDFEFKHDQRPRSGQANTKNFFFDRYRIPAYTYEIGDEEDRAVIADTTPVFAEEMMRLMLEYSEADQVVNRDNAVANEGRPAPLPLPTGQ